MRLEMIKTGFREGLKVKQRWKFKGRSLKQKMRGLRGFDRFKIQNTLKKHFKCSKWCIFSILFSDSVNIILDICLKYHNLLLIKFELVYCLILCNFEGTWFIIWCETQDPCSMLLVF